MSSSRRAPRPSERARGQGPGARANDPFPTGAPSWVQSYLTHYRLWTGLDVAGLDWAGLGWTGLDWTGLGWAELG